LKIVGTYLEPLLVELGVIAAEVDYKLHLECNSYLVANQQNYAPNSAAFNRVIGLINNWGE
jgi:hypothetical protein